MDSEKSTHSFEIKKRYVTQLFIINFFFYQFDNNYSALLSCKTNVLDMFNMGDFFPDFRYIAKYWNSDQIKLLAGNVRNTSLTSKKSFWDLVNIYIDLLPDQFRVIKFFHKLHFFISFILICVNLICCRPYLQPIIFLCFVRDLKRAPYCITLSISRIYWLGPRLRYV